MTDLQKFATEIRIAQLDAFEARGFGHIGGSLSATDVIAVLYGGEMNIDPKNPSKHDRDRFVCSKGHAGPAIYAALALKGYFPLEDIKTLNQPGTKFPSHCDRNLTPGIDMTTGSLGQGASLAAGMAHGLLIEKNDARVFLLIGDGESDEGQIWEMALYAPAKKLKNLVTFVDCNHKQLDGETDDIIPLGDMRQKFDDFGWYALNVEKGNDPDAIAAALKKAEAEHGDKPICIVLQTVKGAGIPDVENMSANHHINVSVEQAEKWRAELKQSLN